MLFTPLQLYLERRLPSAIIIGAKKSGTGALLTFLCQHPDIVGSRKEVHFFDNDENYAKGLEFYRQQMPETYPGKTGDEGRRGGLKGKRRGGVRGEGKDIGDLMRVGRQRHSIWRGEST